MSCLLRVGVGRNRLAGPPDGVEDDREKSDQDHARTSRVRCAGVDREGDEHDGRDQRSEADHHDAAARVGPQPVGSGADDQKEHQRGGAPDGGDRGQVDEVGDDEDRLRR